MRVQLHSNHALAVSAVMMAFCVPMQAGSSRTFVATTGNDSNVTANCGATTNCRTFATALSVTNPGGEIVVVNSGGYGPATISQPVIITAIGIDASISVTTSGNGLTINTTGNVTLTGLNLHGEATGTDGILIQKVGILRLYSMLIENFTFYGVNFQGTGKLSIYGSEMNDNGSAGLLVQNASADAFVSDSSFENLGNGVAVSAGFATVVNSSANNNFVAYLAEGGTLTLSNDRAAFNTIALESGVGGNLYFSNCLIFDNSNSYIVGAESTITGTGTSLITPGQATDGTLSTPITLK